MGNVIEKIRSGGQSGADRGAFDAARDLGVPIVGWCPKGGWAEDFPSPPGLLALYPELEETPSSEVNQRTEWNVRDSDATLILVANGEIASPGTLLTKDTALALGKPLLIAEPRESEKIYGWLKTLGQGIVLNIAGPRESESPGIYEEVYTFVKRLLSEFADG